MYVLVENVFNVYNIMYMSIEYVVVLNVLLKNILFNSEYFFKDQRILC